MAESGTPTPTPTPVPAAPSGTPIGAVASASGSGGAGTVGAAGSGGSSAATKPTVTAGSGGGSGGGSSTSTSSRLNSWYHFGSQQISSWLNWFSGFTADDVREALASFTADGGGEEGGEAVIEPFEDVELPVTQRVLEWAAAVAEHPDTFVNFPKQHLNLKAANEMTGYQVSHASKVLALCKPLAALRHHLCPKQISEKQFWRVYFLLLRNIQRKMAAAQAAAEAKAAGATGATAAPATATAPSPAPPTSNPNTKTEKKSAAPAATTATAAIAATAVPRKPMRHPQIQTLLLPPPRLLHRRLTRLKPRRQQIMTDRQLKRRLHRQCTVEPHPQRLIFQCWTAYPVRRMICPLPVRP